MSRLIDADALMDAMRDEEFQTFVPLDEIDSVIDKAPTIDAVPVVHARWEERGQDDQDEGMYRCSHCLQELYFEEFEFCVKRYCPRCGAKMDGGSP